MRKLIVCNIVSLDGFFAGPSNDLSVMPFDHGFSEYNAQRIRAADTLLLGRKTFAGFRQYWPAVAADETEPDLEREIAQRNTAMEKVVVSDSLVPDQLGGWGPVRVVNRANAHAEVAALKAAEGRDILVFGSHTLWNDLLTANLIDEIHLMIGPGLAGQGVRAFNESAPRRFSLLEHRKFDGSGLLLARYAVAP